jgi:hypothetical protein
MSEPLAERLSAFTPDASALNRDALLFAAGRASARPSRRWQILAAVLAASQVITLVCLWPPTPPSAALVAPNPRTETPSNDDPLDLPPPPNSEEGTIPAGLLSGEIDRSHPLTAKEMIPPEPPLHAFGTALNTILN